MNRSFKLLTMITLTTSYTALHTMDGQPAAKAALAEQVLSTKDRLQEQKMRCMDLYINSQDTSINDISLTMDMLNNAVKQGTDSRCSSPDTVGIKAMETLSTAHLGATSAYATLILKIQEIQLNEMNLEKLKASQETSDRL